MFSGNTSVASQLFMSLVGLVVYLAVPLVFKVCLYISGFAVLILKYVPERQLSN